MNVSRENEGAKPATASEDHRQYGLDDGLYGLRQLMDRLLGEDGCPWDRAQTLESLRPYLLEETHEVLESMEDAAAHRIELGDLLFQIVFQSALREREGKWDLDGVIEAIRSKMIRRHPHVFAAQGEAAPKSPEEVEAEWAKLKAEERGTTDGPADPLAGVPTSLPALQRAWRLQNKAAGVGFDWPDVHGALDKAREEWVELTEAIESGDKEAIREELGDLLFVLVRVGQKLDIEAEDALRRTSRKFERRFAHVMKRCHEDGVAAQEAGLERLEGYWGEAKRLFATPPAPAASRDPSNA